eukprot:m51a1_g4056 hypothetical protein (149) ;mRNA; r:712241-712815
MCSKDLVCFEELHLTLEGLKHATKSQSFLSLARNVLLPRWKAPAAKMAHHKALEREITTSALRLAAKANLLTEILDAASRLHCTQHLQDAHSLAATLVTKKAIGIVRAASNLPKVDEYLVLMRIRLSSMESARSPPEQRRARSGTMPW